MRGKISQWKDDKGFGFILPEGGGEKLFVHISSIKSQSKRPRIGDVVLYDSKRDAQGRLRAKSVVFEDATSKNNGDRRRTIIHTEPLKKNAIDYIAMFVAILSVAVGMFVFYKTGSIEKSALMGILLVISIIVLSRQKKPKEKLFTCMRCKKAEKHSKRTINAWNNGFTKLYCRACHNKWLRKNEDPTTYIANHKGEKGCLGVAVLLTFVPVLAGYGIYEWFV